MISIVSKIGRREIDQYILFEVCNLRIIMINFGTSNFDANDFELNCNFNTYICFVFINEITKLVEVIPNFDTKSS